MTQTPVPLGPVTARVVEQRGRLRVKTSDGLFVQCPRAWRETLPAGRPLVLDLVLRSDRRCYVLRPAP